MVSAFQSGPGALPRRDAGTCPESGCTRAADSRVGDLLCDREGEAIGLLAIGHVDLHSGKVIPLFRAGVDEAGGEGYALGGSLGEDFLGCLL